MKRTEHVGIDFPEILIPESKTNLKKWAVIACDQFTSDEDYWIKTSKVVGGAPSTLHIIVPEAFLKSEDITERIGHARATMANFIEDGVLVRLPKGVVLVERETPYGTRVGVMLAVDLEAYDVDHTKKPLIRATELTVTDRIPPRVKLREASIIECPHIMLLIDDVKNTVIGPVYDYRKQAVQIYNTPLMMDGGNVRGWFIDDEDILDGIVSALENLKKRSKDGILFAVGDGNHSLASAKAVWENRKEQLTEEERETDPLRYALVEVVNLFDNGISMLPIHRVLFNVEPSNALRTLVSILNGLGTEARMMYTKGGRTPVKPGIQIINFESKMSKGRIELAKPQHELVGITLTLALDKLLEEMPRAEVDYIHGDEEFHELANEHGCLGFFMEPMAKEELFESVIEFGVLPRKSFSLGRPEEKRYYFECRLLVDARAAQDTDENGEDELYDEEQQEAAGQGMQTPAETDNGRKEAQQTYGDRYADEEDDSYMTGEENAGHIAEDKHVNKRRPRREAKEGDFADNKRRPRYEDEEDDFADNKRRPRYEDEEDDFADNKRKRPRYEDEEDGRAVNVRRPRYEDEEDGRAANVRRPRYEDEEDGRAANVRRPRYEDEEDGRAANVRRPRYEDEEDGRPVNIRRPRYEDEEDGYAAKRRQPRYDYVENESAAGNRKQREVHDEEDHDNFDYFSDEDTRAPRKKGKGLFGRRRR